MLRGRAAAELEAVASPKAGTQRRCGPEEQTQAAHKTILENRSFVLARASGEVRGLGLQKATADSVLIAFPLSLARQSLVVSWARQSLVE